MQAFRKMQNIHLRAQIHTPGSQASSGEQEAVEKHPEGSILVLRGLLKKENTLGLVRRGKPDPVSCPLTFTCPQWHTCIYIHVHTYNSYIHSRKLNK